MKKTSFLLIFSIITSQWLIPSTVYAGSADKPFVAPKLSKGDKIAEDLTSKFNFTAAEKCQSGYNVSYIYLKDNVFVVALHEYETLENTVENLAFEIGEHSLREEAKSQRIGKIKVRRKRFGPSVETKHRHADMCKMQSMFGK